ncbi:hypothetical protein ACFX11_026798 [Malus domestica]
MSILIPCSKPWNNFLSPSSSTRTFSTPWNLKSIFPGSVASGVSRPLQRQGRAAVTRRASDTGYQKVPDSGAFACRQVSASVTPAGVTRSSAVGSLWMIRSAHIPSALILSRCAVRPPSLALGIQSGRDAAISSEVCFFFLVDVLPVVKKLWVFHRVWGKV